MRNLEPEKIMITNDGTFLNYILAIAAAQNSEEIDREDYGFGEEEEPIDDNDDSYMFD